MDRRDNAPQENGFLKDLKTEEIEYDDKVEYNGKTYRVPYKMIKEAVFSNLESKDLIDIEHCARLQYRLLLLDSVLKAKVEFIRNRITVIYNPKDAANRKEKISKEELIAFIEKEGVIIDPQHVSERDVDYVKEIYTYQFEPATIREHAPYGYSMSEWKRMKPEWEKKQSESIRAKYNKFRKWQNSYLEQHDDLAKEYNYVKEEKKVGLVGKLLGKGKKEGEKDKGFWFHGV